MLQLAGEVRLRLNDYFNRWPFKLLDLIVAEAGVEFRARVAAEFFSTPLCCVDVAFLRRLRQWGGGQLDNLCSELVLAVLRAWSRHGKLSIAHSGRMHAQHKRVFASTRPGTLVSVEASLHT